MHIISGLCFAGSLCEGMKTHQCRQNAAAAWHAGSTFDFRTGEIKDWYPSNVVLRLLTPASTCRNLETYPVRLEQVGASLSNGRAPQYITAQLPGFGWIRPGAGGSGAVLALLDRVLAHISRLRTIVGLPVVATRWPASLSGQQHDPSHSPSRNKSRK